MIPCWCIDENQRDVIAEAFAVGAFMAIATRDMTGLLSDVPDLAAQIGGIIAVLIAAGDLIDALAQEVFELMPNHRLVPVIMHTTGQGRGQTQAPVGFPNQHHATVAGDLTAIETTPNGLAMKESKAELLKTLCHAGEPRRNAFYVV